MNYVNRESRVSSAAMSVLLVAFAILVPVTAHAATLTVGPSDCSAAAVNSAIASASNGDTVLLTCGGTQTWTSTVTIPSSKGITLQVQGGTNTPKASASFPLTIVGSSGLTAIRMSIGVGKAPTRVTGFKFRNSGTSHPFIRIDGQGTGTTGTGGFRLDNNYLDGVSGSEVIAVWSNGGPLYGVIDNNTLFNVYRASDPSYGPYAIQIWNYWHPSGDNQCWGCDGWTAGDFAYGSAKSVFIEDNLFKQTSAASGHMRHYISSELGGRYVSRHNTFENNYGDTNADLHDAHGLCIVGSNGAGARGGEIYANTISGSSYNRAMQLRGGSWLVYDNTITPGGDSPIEFNEYRAEITCDSTNRLAPVMPPWPVPPGAGWAANAPWVPHVTSGNNYPLPQQIHNSYVWNNRNASGGALINPAVPGGMSTTYIQNNRDYFASGTKPAALSSYTPYTYPHPLVGGGGGSSQPPAPTNLRVM